jgi:hypothetical protein
MSTPEPDPTLAAMLDEEHASIVRDGETWALDIDTDDIEAMWSEQ